VISIRLQPFLLSRRRFLRDANPASIR